MVIRSFDGIEPQVAESAHVDETAVVIGDVVIEDGASVWPNATLRGDHGRIVVGRESNVQDNAVLHEDAVLEPRVTVGHGAIVHACTVREGALVGMNAVVLDRADVGEGTIVAAGSVVTEDTELPAEKLVAGTPATVIGDAAHESVAFAAETYVELSRTHAGTSERID
jgi:carbonic anhydrase/acetyltransferase-like protein (isoleucine patch superfamily)